MDSITDRIWIGNSHEAKDRDSLQLAGIRSTLCLDGCMAGVRPEEVGVDRVEVVELIDGSGNRPEVFLRAVRLFRELAAKHPPVLVHCYAGRSRSAAVVCRLFMSEEGNNLREAMRRITSKRKVAIAAALQEFLNLK
jgi:protein-tyrosine phosphatase